MVIQRWNIHFNINWKFIVSCLKAILMSCFQKQDTLRFFSRKGNYRKLQYKLYEDIFLSPVLLWLSQDNVSKEPFCHYLLFQKLLLLGVPATCRRKLCCCKLFMFLFVCLTICRIKLYEICYFPV